VRVSRCLVLQTLQRHGYPGAIAVGTGAAALDAYRHHVATLRIVLMDINLPDISGTDVTQRIRALEAMTTTTTNTTAPHTHKLLIFGLTGNTDAQNLDVYETVGMNGCIAKGGGGNTTTSLVDALAKAIAVATESQGTRFVVIA
jgi:CheY-like chemotaxis protein